MTYGECPCGRVVTLTNGRCPSCIQGACRRRQAQIVAEAKQFKAYIRYYEQHPLMNDGGKCDGWSDAIQELREEYKDLKRRINDLHR